MVTVPKTQPTQTIQGDTGQVMAPINIMGEPMAKTIGDAGIGLSNALAEAGKRIRDREDIISSAVSNDEFEQETLKSFNATLEAGNILDPKQNTIGKFNAETEQRIARFLNNSNVSASAKSKLEASLRSRGGQYGSQLIQFQNTEQRKYIAGIAQNEIAPFAAEVAKNPEMLHKNFDAVDEIVNRYAPVLDPASERSLRDAARSSVMEQAVSGLINGGKWKEANSLLLDNPVLMKYLDPSKKDQFNKQIANFAQAENESTTKMAARIAQLTMLSDAGYSVDPKKAANFVAGAEISPDATVGEKIVATEQSLIDNKVMTSDQIKKLPLNVRASFGGVTLPEGPPVDFNKDYMPNGELSPKGVYGRIKPYMDASTEIQRQSSMLENLYAQYKTNPLAGLGILQGYLKMIDDGAVVRDSDIRLAESASSAATRFQTAINSLTKGEAVSGPLVEQAIQAARAFTAGSNEVSKATVDGYLQDTGYSMMKMGYPQATYDLLFSKTRKVSINKEADATTSAPAKDPLTAGNDGVSSQPGVIVIKRNPDGTLNTGN
jgi:hypothetical protein